MTRELEARIDALTARLEGLEVERALLDVLYRVDDLVLCPDGDWRFERRIAEVESL